MAAAAAVGSDGLELELGLGLEAGRARGDRLGLGRAKMLAAGVACAAAVTGAASSRAWPPGSPDIAK